MKKLILILCTLLMLALPALAEDAPAMSGELTLLKTANEALIERYHMTLAALGLFEASVDVCGETAIVTYESSSGIPASLTGTYYVIIAPHGVQPLWTHDGSLVPWQTGELDSPVWGMPQLLIYLNTSSSERHAAFTPYFPAELDTLAAFEAAGGSYHEVTSANSGAAHSAKALALRAVTALYGLSEEESAALVSYGGDTRLVRYPDHHGEWAVLVHLPGGPEEICFYITIHAETGLILDAVIASGGVG